jgi:4-amino-4-deoxy-L-arabinose transferase-like glycosyltransferase
VADVTLGGSVRRWYARWTLLEVGGPLVLLAVAIALLFFDLGSRILVTNDEARFPLLARDILGGGSWILPQLDHTPYSNKPPLCAWLIAMAAWPAGHVTQVSALWPSLVAALGVAIATTWIGWRLSGPTSALIAGFVAVTTHGVFTLARTPTPDMVLCLFLTAAMTAFVASRFGERRALMVACYALLGLGLWAKGPPALMGVLILVAVGGSTEGWVGLRRLGLPWGLLIVVGSIAPWWIVSARRGGAHFWSSTVATDWIAWYLPSGDQGWRAFTDPLGQTFAVLLPWSVLMPFALAWALRRGRLVASGNVTFLLVWLAVVFVIVGVSKQQRMRYYLPLCPPAALILGAWLPDLRLRHARALALTTASAVALGLIVWQLHDTDRHNHQTDLAALRRPILANRAPLFAVDLPELVLAFYLDRTVHSLSTSDSALRQIATPSYLAVADRTLPRWLTRCSSPPVGVGLVDGRAFSFLRLEPAGCGAPLTHPASGLPVRHAPAPRSGSE